jgi:hypothetical protein
LCHPVHRTPPESRSEEPTATDFADCIRVKFSRQHHETESVKKLICKSRR